MTGQITLYSFVNRDRSGKIRWTAYELGYSIDEQRVEFGAHRRDEYAALNPYRQIPAMKIDGQVMLESTAACINLAERHPDSGLIPDIDAPSRAKFWEQAALATQTLEYPVVHYFLSQAGIVDEVWGSLLEDRLREHFAVYVKNVPEQGWWLGESFTLVDIFAAYVLRIAVRAGLLDYRGVLQQWFERLMARPASQQACFFEGFPED